MDAAAMKESWCLAALQGWEHGRNHAVLPLVIKTTTAAAAADTFSKQNQTITRDGFFFFGAAFEDRLRLDEVIVGGVVIHNEVFQAYDEKGKELEWDSFRHW